jgi:hypothetical protein
VNTPHTPIFERDLVSVVRPFHPSIHPSFGIDFETWLLAHYSCRPDAGAAQNSLGGRSGNGHGRDGSVWSGKRDD